MANECYFLLGNTHASDRWNPFNRKVPFHEKKLGVWRKRLIWFHFGHTLQFQKGPGFSLACMCQRKVTALIPSFKAKKSAIWQGTASMGISGPVLWMALVIINWFVFEIRWPWVNKYTVRPSGTQAFYLFSLMAPPSRIVLEKKTSVNWIIFGCLYLLTC